jgi:nucleoside-diphosphate-sugar epimerase
MNIRTIGVVLVRLFCIYLVITALQSLTYILPSLFATLEGYETEIKPLEDKPVGVHSRYADISHMKEILDWVPTISIEEGFGRVLRVAHERKAKGL